MARFCVNCGGSLDGISGKIAGYSKKIQHQSRQWIEKMRDNLDRQISGYLEQLNSKDRVQIAGVNVPESKRDNVRRALISFREKIASDNNSDEEFQKWMEVLPDMLIEQKCLVCFVTWKKDADIVVCPHCHAGGHRDHLVNWVRERKICPLCREIIGVGDLLVIKTIEKIDKV